MSHPSNPTPGETPEPAPGEPYAQPPSYGASQPSYGQGAPAYGQPAYPQAAYGQPAYGQGGYGYDEPPPPPKTNGLAIAALVLGIIGLLLCWIPFLGLGLGVVAIILGLLGLRRRPAGKGMSIAGLVLGALAVVGGILILIVVNFLVSVAEECENQTGATSGSAFQQCVADRADDIG